jgi:hypothetical protein
VYKRPNLIQTFDISKCNQRKIDMANINQLKANLLETKESGENLFFV